MWQGWADNGIPPTGTVDYYDILTQRMGGQASAEKFARLFLFPSVYHCGGGYANAVMPDLIYPMVQWVEDRTTPDQLTISYTVNSNTFSRPVYPYPDIPKYNGSGDESSAASFHSVVSSAAHYTSWIGNYLFFQPIGGRGLDQGYARHR